MTKWIFFFGREPVLSAAEILARLKDWNGRCLAVTSTGAAVETDAFEPRLLSGLGGTVKVARLIEQRDADQARTVFEDCLTPAWLRRHVPGDRFEFGLSSYGSAASQRTLAIRARKLKQELKRDGVHARYVSSREPQLSAVTVTRNKLLAKGKEFVFWPSGRTWYIGETVAVQDYQAYGLRDFGRPAADPKSGMVPPKLAQIMLNLARVTPEDVLLDPFCGSGTIIQEAALLGVRKIFGSDNSPRAIKDAQLNMNWLLKEFPGLQTDVEIVLRDARKLPMRPTAIVTEPDLGRPQRGHEQSTALKRDLQRVSELYLQAFTAWSKVLGPGARVVMLWPEFQINGRRIEPNIASAVSGLGFQPHPFFHDNEAAAVGVDDPYVLSYGRPEAKIRRRIRAWIFDKA